MSQISRYLKGETMNPLLEVGLQFKDPLIYGGEYKIERALVGHFFSTDERELLDLIKIINRHFEGVTITIKEVNTDGMAL